MLFGICKSKQMGELKLFTESAIDKCLLKEHVLQKTVMDLSSAISACISGF